MYDSMTKPEDAEEKERAVNRALAILREHFQCGLVLVSNEDGPKTAQMFSGFGNGYALVGMAYTFLKGSTNDDSAD